MIKVLRFVATMACALGTYGCCSCCRDGAAPVFPAYLKPGQGTSASFAELLVRVELSTATIVRGSISRGRLPRTRLHSPRLDEHASGAEVRELVFAWHDAKGELLESFGVPFVPIMLGDSIETSGRTTARSYRPSIDERALAFPVPERAAYLGVYSTQVSLNPSSFGCMTVRNVPLLVDKSPASPATQAPRLVTQLGGLYDVAGTGGGAPDLRFEIPGAKGSTFAPAAGCHFTWPTKKAFLVSGDVSEDGTQWIARPRCNSAAFHIVILGDGFKSRDKDKFDLWAGMVWKNLSSQEPYSSHLDHVWVDSVWTQSDLHDSCYEKDKKSYPGSTHYGVYRGGEEPVCQTRSPTYFASDNIGTVVESVKKVVPYAAADLIVMLVDCNMKTANGGKVSGNADLENRIAYIPAPPDDPEDRKLWDSLVIHETAHAAAHLADEYVACAPADDTWLFPNVASTRDVTDCTVPWLGLATGAELQSPCLFSHVHECTNAKRNTCGFPLWSCCNDNPPPCVSTDPACAGVACCGDPCVDTTGDGSALGLYCGSMFGKDGDDASGQSCQETCTALNTYYRPTTKCRMGYSMYDSRYGYCRVCSKAIETLLCAHRWW